MKLATRWRAFFTIEEEGATWGHLHDTTNWTERKKKGKHNEHSTEMDIGNSTELCAFHLSAEMEDMWRLGPFVFIHLILFALTLCGYTNFYTSLKHTTLHFIFWVSSLNW